MTRRSLRLGWSGRPAFPAAACVAALFLAACGSSETNEPGPDVWTAVLGLNNLVMLPGDTVQIQATVRRNGAEVTLSQVQGISEWTYSVSSGQAATVVNLPDGSALVIGVAEGSATIRFQVVDVRNGNFAADDGQVQVKGGIFDADTKSLDSVTVVSDSAEVTAGTVRVQGAAAADYPVGTVLLKQDVANPILKKVTGATQNGSQAVLSVEDAALNEAFTDLQWNTSQPLTLAASATPGSPALAPAATPWLAPGVSVSRAGVISFDGSGLSFTIPAADGLLLTVGAQIEGGFITFEPTFNAKLEIGAGTVERFRATAGGNFGFGVQRATFNLSGTAVSTATPGGGSTTYDPQKYKKARKPLARFPFPPTCVPPGICFVIELGFDAEVATTGTLTGSFSTGGSTTTSIEAGLEFANGTLSPVLVSNGSTQTQPVTVSIGGELGITLTVTPSVFVKFYNIGGPYLGFPASLDVKAGIDNWDWFVNSTAKLELELGGKIEVLGFTVAQLSSSWDLLKSTIGTGGHAATLTLPATAAMSTGGTAQLVPTFTYLGVPWTVPPIRWLSGDPSIVSIDAAGRMTAHKEGTTQVGGQLFSNPQIQAITEVTVQADQLIVNVTPATTTVDRGANQTWQILVSNGSTPVPGATVDIIDRIQHSSGVPSQVTTNAQGAASYQLQIPNSALLGPTSLSFTASKSGFNTGTFDANVDVYGALKLAVFPPNFQCPTTCPGNEDEVAGPYAPAITILDWYDVTTQQPLSQPSPGDQRTFLIAVENVGHPAATEGGVAIDVVDPFSGTTTTVTTALRTGFGSNPVALYTFTVPAGTAPGTYQFAFGPAQKAWFRPTPVYTRGVVVVP